ncbi:MAG TPA: hypothetical protein PK970_13230 [Hyphomicrobiaceae bacterium]|nr:hypothetical protein [Hyphomicrobiaceae bacterium]
MISKHYKSILAVATLIGALALTAPLVPPTSAQVTTLDDYKPTKETARGIGQRLGIGVGFVGFCPNVKWRDGVLNAMRDVALKIEVDGRFAEEFAKGYAEHALGFRTQFMQYGAGMCTEAVVKTIEPVNLELRK